MRDEEVQKPQRSPSSGSSSSGSSSSSTNSAASSFNVKKESSGSESLFGRGKYKLWALAAITLLALWSMFTGTVTLKWSAVNLNHSEHDLDPSLIHGDLDVLDVDEREKVVRQMWNVYTHSRTDKLPRFWRDAFGAAYQDLTSEVSSVREAALSEIAKMSLRSRDVYETPRAQSTPSMSKEAVRAVMKMKAARKQK